jgi:hypothetical protein
MFVGSLTDAELKTLVVALKYWRRHRRGGRSRKTDHLLPPRDVDILVTKLGTGILGSLPPDEVIADLSSH